jgi:hypothetical protein
MAIKTAKLNTSPRVILTGCGEGIGDSNWKAMALEGIPQGWVIKAQLWPGG